jgi:hypothetical protein
LTREQVLAAVEKFEKDEELDKLLGDITSLSDMFNILKEENIEARVWFSASSFFFLSHSILFTLLRVQPLPEHVTKELVLAIAKENADMTIKVIQATSAKQKAEKLSDEQAAELAEFVSFRCCISIFIPIQARVLCFSCLLQERSTGLANGEF